MKLYYKFYVTRSVLFQFFISYICILAFTLFASSILHHQTTNIIKQENNRANDAILKQFSEALDDELNYMCKLAIQAYTGVESEISSYNRYKESNQSILSSYARYQACNFLTTLNIATENIENIFIYYNSDDYIISLFNSVPSDIFYQSYYNQLDDFTLEEWNNVLKSYSVNGFISFPSKTGAKSIAFVYSPFKAGKSGKDKVFVSFNPYKLQKLLDNSKWESNGAFLVFNSNGALLASTDSYYNDIDLSSYFNVHIDDFFNIEHEDTEYVCKIIQSPSTKCYYASITPKTLATESVSYSEKLELIFILVVIPIGLLACYILSQRNYLPFKRLIKWIDEKAMYDPESFEQGNEIDILEKVLQLSFEEQEKLIMQIHSRKSELIVSSIRDLLYGTSNQGDTIEEVFAKNDLSLLSKQFAVILINLEKRYTNHKDHTYSHNLVSFIITNVIEELANKKHQGFVVPIDENRYGCLVNLSPSNTMEQDMISIAKEGKDFLEENFGIYFTVSLSTIHAEIDGIHQAFQEALYAMEYRLTVGSNKVIPYQQHLQDDSIYTFSFKTDYSINIFIKELKDNSQIGSFVCKLFENRNINSHTPPAIARDFIYDVAGSLSKSINDMLPENLQWKEDIYNRLINCDTLELFHNELINILEEYQEYLRKKLSQNSISAQARKYIEKNYHDPSLSVNILGDKFNLSPSYLSRTFKEENGISILDYISKCRINNAKELLKNTNKTIQQIAIETGFLSSSVFIRVFKKLEGITPGAYRKI